MFAISRCRALGCRASRRDFFRITALRAADLELFPSLRAAQAVTGLPRGKKAVILSWLAYEKDVDWWDDHYTIEKNLRKRLPLYDQALYVLLQDLSVRGSLNNELVVACGEFGRAPRIDSNAGRGHWPFVLTANLAGGDIRTGRIIDATNLDGG